MLSISEVLDCPMLGYEDTHSVNSEKLEMVEQAIAILESQKRKAMQDISFLQNKKKEILAKPVEFIYKLRDGSEPCFPLPQIVTKIPENLTQHLPEESSDSSVSSDNESLMNDLERSPSPPVKKIWNKKDEQQLRKFLKVYSDEYSDEERFALISKAMGNRSIEQIMEKFALIQSQDKSLALPGYSVPIMLKGNLKPGEETEEYFDESEYYDSTEDDN